MNWHTRYAQQANWTRTLRSYIFEKTGRKNTGRILEVGCGTGAILSELPEGAEIHGLDSDQAALNECGRYAPSALRVQGNALALPYPDRSFDIVYSHFLLLWVRDPSRALQEMKRVSRPGGHIIAFAEPDYLERVDAPEELVPLGRWQTDSLRRQGADPGLGAWLGELFFDAGITIRETGSIQNNEMEPSLADWQIEWDVLESDLRGRVPDQELQSMKALDKQARQQGTRLLHVPTYFAWGQV
jgi:SAM-dependent methyltransferase